MCGELDVNSVMRSWFVLLILAASVDAQGSSPSCVPVISVRKNTVYRTPSRRPLRVSCPVTFCNEVSAIAWTKVEVARMVPMKLTNQIEIGQERSPAGSYLVFRNITEEDAGIYRCGIYLTNYSIESHNININVSDNFVDAVDGITASSSAPAGNQVRGLSDSWLFPVVVAAAILGLVGVVFSASFLIVFGCSGRSKTREKRLRHRGAPPAPPELDGRPGTLTGHHVSVDLARADLDPLYPLHPDTGGDSQQIVYATLEHLTSGETSALHQQAREEPTEYAAIRVN